MSDTHGNRSLMHAAADAMVMAGAARIFHLGDDYQDAEELALAGHDVTVVPGLWCPEYRSVTQGRQRVVGQVGQKIPLEQSCAHLATGAMAQLDSLEVHPRRGATESFFEARRHDGFPANWEL